MKIFQELVKQLQVIQLRESAANGQRATVYTQEFRGIEFAMRNFINTNMRKAVSLSFESFYDIILSSMFDLSNWQAA